MAGITLSPEIKEALKNIYTGPDGPAQKRAISDLQTGPTTTREIASAIQAIDQCVDAHVDWSDALSKVEAGTSCMPAAGAPPPPPPPAGGGTTSDPALVARVAKLEGDLATTKTALDAATERIGNLEADPAARKGGTGVKTLLSVSYMIPDRQGPMMSGLVGRVVDFKYGQMRVAGELTGRIKKASDTKDADGKTIPSTDHYFGMGSASLGGRLIWARAFDDTALLQGVDILSPGLRLTAGVVVGQGPDAHIPHPVDFASIGRAEVTIFGLDWGDFRFGGFYMLGTNGIEAKGTELSAEFRF